MNKGIALVKHISYDRKCRFNGEKAERYWDMASVVTSNFLTSS